MPVSLSRHARLVVAHRLRAAGCVFAEDEVALLAGAASTPGDFAAMVERRIAGLPLEQVVGWAQFCDLRVAVDPGVFVPRRRTEFLVSEAALLGAGRPRPPVVVDVCCGTGAIGLALAAALGEIELHAVDIEPAAARCARRNLAGIGLVYEGDLYEPLPGAIRSGVDLLVANVPYVPTAQIVFLPGEARRHEPPVTLDGGVDGLDLARRVIDGAPSWLATGGHLVIETSERQAASVFDIVARSGLLARVATCEELDATVVIAAKR